MHITIIVYKKYDASKLTVGRPGRPCPLGRLRGISSLLISSLASVALPVQRCEILHT